MTCFSLNFPTLALVSSTPVIVLQRNVALGVLQSILMWKLGDKTLHPTVDMPVFRNGGLIAPDLSRATIDGRSQHLLILMPYIS